MIFFTPLHVTPRHRTSQHNATQHDNNSPTPHATAHHSTPQRSATQHDKHSPTQHRMSPSSTAQHYATLHESTQHSNQPKKMIPLPLVVISWCAVILGCASIANAIATRQDLPLLGSIFCTLIALLLAATATSGYRNQ